MDAVSEPARGESFVLEPRALQALLDAIVAEGYQIRGPLVRDHAVCLDEVTRVEQLPVGWTDEQEGGHYRLTRRGGSALFPLRLNAGIKKRSTITGKNCRVILVQSNAAGCRISTVFHGRLYLWYCLRCY